MQMKTFCNSLLLVASFFYALQAILILWVGFILVGIDNKGISEILINNSAEAQLFVTCSIIAVVVLIAGFVIHSRRQTHRKLALYSICFLASCSLLAAVSLNDFEPIVFTLLLEAPAIIGIALTVLGYKQYVSRYS